MILKDDFQIPVQPVGDNYSIFYHASFYLNVYCFHFAEKRENDLQGQVNTEAFHSQRTPRQGDIAGYMQLGKKRKKKITVLLYLRFYEFGTLNLFFFLF